VVGGGKAGKSLAMDRAKARSKVAMVERDKIRWHRHQRGLYPDQTAGVP
jgi:pyruvate/2-oxoglutarate dehydrogenase complex dihydrolipoamide dehydrogenase (E3) component